MQAYGAKEIESTAARAEELFQEHSRHIHQRTDRLFAALMVVQLGGAIVIALTLSPLTWEGGTSRIHPHVWAAVFLGGAIASLPIGLALFRPGRFSTRLVIASAQMLMSALLIHLMGGRIEAHFHVFGSLAFLGFYRDSRVFIPATIVVGLDHMMRGLYWPESVFGVTGAQPWRWLEHTAWVLFEDLFLARSCLQGVLEMREIAQRRAQLEGTAQRVEAEVHERTAELRSSEQLFRSLASCLPLGVFKCRSDPPELLYANELLLGILEDGNRRAGQPSWLAALNPDDLDGVHRDWMTATRAGVEFSRELRRTSPASRIYRVRAAPLPTEPGHYVGIVEDITERRAQEEQLALMQRRNESILDSAAEGIILLDREATIVFANASAKAQLACDACVGRPIQKILQEHPEDSLHPIAATLADGRPRSSTAHAFRRRDGRLFPVQLWCTPIQEDSTLTGVVVTFHDTTEERKLQAALLQSKKLESIGHLAAGIAHEINTPTQYVGDNMRFLQEAFTELISNVTRLRELEAASEHDERTWERMHELLTSTDVDYLAREVPEAFEQSQEGIRRVTQIVRAMKDFSHPSEEFQPSDLNRAVESTVIVARNEWKYVADLTTDLDAGLGLVPCMLGDVNQVVLNVIVNAAHAIAQKTDDGRNGKGEIHIHTRRDAQFAEIGVRDSGCGIPTEIMDKIFDPFFTTKEVGKGTGQGLSVAHALIAGKHGGTISVESEVGRGTLVLLRLPLVRMAEPAACR